MFRPLTFLTTAMANTKSALKAARKTERQTIRNKGVKTRLKTLHKKFSAAVEAGEAEAALAHEPIRRTEAWLLENGLSQDELDGMRDEVTAEIAGYVEDAKPADWPDPSLAFTDVQDGGAPAIPGVAS